MEQRQTLTESMFYVLMCFYQKPTFGIEIVETIRAWSDGQLVMGPGTLYTILGRFEKDKLIKEIHVEGRKRTYEITNLGKEVFESELRKLNKIVNVGQKLVGNTEREG